MDLEISGRVALVLGAGGGLGSAIARKLSLEGARVALADVDEAALANASTEIEKLGGQCMCIRFDLADVSSIERNVNAVEARLGPVDILVNNTGGPAPSPASGVSAEIWTSQFNAMV